MELTEKAKSFEEICQEQGLNPADEIAFKNPGNARQKAVNAAAKLFIIAEYYNQGWKPNWYNWDEYKYYPWFDMSPEKKSSNEGAAAGSGFSFRDYAVGASASHVGARLVFKSRKLAEYVGKHYLEIYRDFMTID